MTTRVRRSAACLTALALLGVLACGARGVDESSRASPGNIRPAAVAWQFYPGEAAALRGAIQGFMADARAPLGEKPVALVLPHAGYIFCGQIMADGYRQAIDHAYDLVVILGTNHTSPELRGVAVDTREAYETPLGRAPIDREAALALLEADPSCTDDTAPFVREHSIEVQVPFVQELWPRARILPVIVGRPDPALCDRFGRALAEVVRGRGARNDGGTLIVASSDLSHYPAKAEAETIDRAVLAAVASLDPARLRATIAEQMRRDVPGLSTCACGEAPILAAMAAARALGATRGAVISYANSGDAPVGEAGGVVGYGAVAFTPGRVGNAGRAGAPETAATLRAAAGATTQAAAGAGLSSDDRRTLLALARNTIRRYLETSTAPLARDCSPSLSVRQGAFVTLKKQGELRGCIGHMAEDTPLCQVVSAMALQAAFNDQRFPPLARGELGEIGIEISVLTPALPVRGPDAIVLGRDGVILRKQGRTAVFLPQVATEQGWDRDTFLTQLARKAGLPGDAWRQGAELSTFQAVVFGEHGYP